jgi:hypothetical protein
MPNFVLARSHSAVDLAAFMSPAECLQLYYTPFVKICKDYTVKKAEKDS